MKNIIVDGPGRLTTKELKKQMRNADKIPFWQMHPLVQHCLRVYQELQPGDIEWYKSESIGWVQNTNSISNMFLDAYRIKAGSFKEGFLKKNSLLEAWQNHFR